MMFVPCFFKGRRFTLSSGLLVALVFAPTTGGIIYAQNVGANKDAAQPATTPRVVLTMDQLRAEAFKLAQEQYLISYKVKKIDKAVVDLANKIATSLDTKAVENNRATISDTRAWREDSLNAIVGYPWGQALSQQEMNNLPDAKNLARLFVIEAQALWSKNTRATRTEDNIRGGKINQELRAYKQAIEQGANASPKIMERPELLNEALRRAQDEYTARYNKAAGQPIINLTAKIVKTLNLEVLEDLQPAGGAMLQWRDNSNASVIAYSTTSPTEFRLLEDAKKLSRLIVLEAEVLWLKNQWIAADAKNPRYIAQVVVQPSAPVTETEPVPVVDPAPPPRRVLPTLTARPGHSLADENARNAPQNKDP